LKAEKLSNVTWLSQKTNNPNGIHEYRFLFKMSKPLILSSFRRMIVRFLAVKKRKK